MDHELERGELYFFYRPKVEADDAAEVQRLYLVLVNSAHYRLLIVGANELPADKDQSGPPTRRWVQVRAVESSSAGIEEILKGGEYDTRTRGRRHFPPAAPVGEGCYALVDTGDSTQLVFRLRRSKRGQLAGTLGLRQEASYIVAVKNPSVEIEGYPGEKPDYPDQLADLFQGRRWLPVRNSGLLNYENAQAILISAHGQGAAEKLGLELDPGSADLRSRIDLDLPEEGLLRSRFPDLAEFEERHHGEILPDFGSGGETGGRAAAASSDSASAVGTLLKDLAFPASKSVILGTARANRTRAEDPDPALQRLEHLPRREFDDMADLQKTLSATTTEDDYPCEICGKEFTDLSHYRRHLNTSHPQQAVSAADLARALSGANYPATTQELADYAEEQNADKGIMEILRDLPERSYRDAAEVEVGFQESITGRQPASQQAPSQKALESTSAAAVASALKGIDLPARPTTLKKHAESSGADPEVVQAIASLPDRSYRDLAEVQEGFSESLSDTRRT